jgi:hypothetical protein
LLAKLNDKKSSNLEEKKSQGSANAECKLNDSQIMRGAVGACTPLVPYLQRWYASTCQMVANLLKYNELR